MTLNCLNYWTKYKAYVSSCSSAVLNSSPRAPLLCIFRMLLFSLQMFVLFERKCPAWRHCAAQIHEWMFRNDGSREQWTLCREHINRNTVHAWSALLTSWLSESGVLTKRDIWEAKRQNMQSGGVRGLELRTSAVAQTIEQGWRTPVRESRSPLEFSSNSN